MVSFLSRIFGGASAGSDGDSGGHAGEPVEYGGYTIRPAPERAGGQWRLAGIIIKQGDDGPMERAFTRADTFSSRDEAESFAVRKARQIIDEQGDGLFSSGAPTGRA